MSTRCERSRCLFSRLRLTKIRTCSLRHRQVVSFLDARLWHARRPTCSHICCWVALRTPPHARTQTHIDTHAHVHAHAGTHARTHAHTPTRTRSRSLYVHDRIHNTHTNQDVNGTDWILKNVITFSKVCGDELKSLSEDCECRDGSTSCRYWCITRS